MEKGVGGGKNSTNKKEFVSPPPHSSNCLGDSLRLEMERTLFATVVMVRFGV